MNFMTEHKLILASASPRRKELFSRLGVPFEIIASDVEETAAKADSVEGYVKEVALLKARDVADKEIGKIIIGADTIVVFEGTLLHKPKNEMEAFSHLAKLSNQCHKVITAVAILQPDGQEEVFIEEAKVYFKKLSRELIEAYIRTGDPYDKAGGYGIQTDGVLFVDRIEGDYNSIVGLPLATLFEKLHAMNIIKV